MQNPILNIFLFFAVAVNIKLNHKIESFRKHHFDLGNMVVDSKKSKCLSQLIGTSVESYIWVCFFFKIPANCFRRFGLLVSKMDSTRLSVSEQSS